MKVQEKETDRRAELHVYAQEQVDALAEYGQYIDPVDHAICAYVPVEEGNVIKVAGRFNGTTYSVHWDLYVDGVLRKANNTISKAVKVQKGVKLDFEEALYQTDDGMGVLDTQMKVVPVSGYNFAQDDELETIGTIEVRLYVLRTFGTEQPLDPDTVTYLDDSDNEDTEEEQHKKATYRTTTPEYMIQFEKNVQELHGKNSKAWMKKLHANRPSKEPWAIFRFHYRSKEAIEAREMKMSHDPKRKGKGAQPHCLQLERVPPLIVGTKPANRNDDRSTRDGSVTPAPSTPNTLRSPFPHRRSSPPPSPLAQRHPVADDEPSDTTVAEEITGKTETVSIHGPTKEPITMAVQKIAVKDETDKCGETKKNTVEEPTEDTNTPAPDSSTPTTSASTALIIAPIAPMLHTTSPTLKRPAAPAPLNLAPEPKRSKSLTIAETRRQIAAMRARREAVAKKRLDVDSELEPYKARMREQREKLAKELEEETRAWKEESQALRDDVAMLGELKKGEGEE